MHNWISQKNKVNLNRKKLSGRKEGSFVREEKKHTEFKPTMTNLAMGRCIINMNLKELKRHVFIWQQITTTKIQVILNNTSQKR